MNLSDWLEAGMQARIEVETVEGCIRRGRLSSVRVKTIKLDDVTAAEPRQIVLDDDEADPVSVLDVVRFTRL